jgi:phospholipid/cholesterol/gamma-HCH transport system ATP-binding protein
MGESGTAASLIEFDQVRLGFAEGEVLRGVSFRVGERESKVLVGETGTGKTLILKLAAGLLRPDSGTIRVLGQDLASLGEKELLEFRKRIGVVFQEGALFDSLSVRENVAYRLREEGKGEDETEDAVREALRFVEMEDAIEQLPGELSGGMRRRVSIARALIGHPPIVLYDSPTAGLDPVTSQTIIMLILRLRDLHGVTALLATHRLQDAFALANFRFDTREDKVVWLATNGGSRDAVPPTRVLVLRDGKVYFEGEQAAILKSEDEYLRKFLV